MQPAGLTDLALMPLKEHAAMWLETDAATLLEKTCNQQDGLKYIALHMLPLKGHAAMNQKQHAILLEKACSYMA